MHAKGPNCTDLPGAPSKFEDVSSVAHNGSASTEPGGPVVDEHGVVFVLADRNRRLSAVRLEQELGIGDPGFARERTRWSLRIARPPVDRMEYLFEIEDANGHRTTITDPANPLRAPGAFGDKSVLTFPGYAPPAWLDATPIDATTTEFAVPAPALDGEVSGTVWSPTQLDGQAEAPLLIVHDGPEFAGLGGFTHYLGAMIAAGTLPPCRAALVSPGERNEWYAANPDYAGTLITDVLPALPPANVRIGVGVSLGALAMLHAHRSHPGALDGLMLQSGSFFTPDLDSQESAFSGFGPVTGFVASVLDATSDSAPVPTVVTCGVAEENLANNQRIAGKLADLGYEVSLRTVRDSHNYTAWRDALDPHLTDLVRAVTGHHAP
jgi:enterochelin esterase-like enzyme